MTDAAFLRAFVEELVAAGLRDAVVCPGSRSTPLALALRSMAGIRVRVLLDERSAGFFALGMARTSRRPVALLATSGTATVEFAPAVVEASLSRVPLVVLTSDRPVELRDRGAPQTIDQDHLYGRAAKWYAELPLADGEPATLAHVRSMVGRAVATAIAGPAGPVQLNVPFREPLLPDGPLAARGDSQAARNDSLTARNDSLTAMGDPLTAMGDPLTAKGDSPGGPFTASVTGRRWLDADAVDRLVPRLAPRSGGEGERGLIIAGPDDDPRLADSLWRLADATGFPILADPLSGLRTGPHDRMMVVVRADQLCRPGPWIDTHLPDVVIRTGAMPTSKPIVEMLARARPDLIVLDGEGGWRESALIPATFVHADPVATVEALARRLGSGWSDTAWSSDWRRADDAADEAMRSWLTGLDEPFEGAPFPVLADALPDGALLWAGSSMPVRDLDSWLPSTDRAITVRSNRGANGIDGVVSTALGSSAVAAAPVALVVGDLSFLHDLNALVAARLHELSATIVLVNNDGGGIFSFLPQASASLPEAGLPEHYEELFGTPHGIDVAPIVTALGGEHRLVDAASLDAAIRDSVGRPGVQVLELRTDRGRNVELHREVESVVRAALAGLLPAAAPGTHDTRAEDGMTHDTRAEDRMGPTSWLR